MEENKPEENKPEENKPEEKKEIEPEAVEANVITPTPWRISLRKTNSSLNLSE